MNKRVHGEEAVAGEPGGAVRLRRVRPGGCEGRWTPWGPGGPRPAEETASAEAPRWRVLRVPETQPGGRRDGRVTGPRSQGGLWLPRGVKWEPSGGRASLR